MDDLSVNPAYVAAERARALRTLLTHPDPAVRARAEARVRRWDAVAAGMVEGRLTIGSRTPVLGAPPWATLEVAHGGFATGALLAEGPLGPDEEVWLTTLAGDSPPRERLHAWALSDPGRAELLDRIRRGTYRIEVPEEGALAVVAWLLDQGHVDGALDVVEAIAPWFGRLRFTPRAAETPLGSAALVHRESARAVARRLRDRPERPAVTAMNAALTVWRPLEDRGLALLFETVKGPPPRVPTGAPRRADGQLVVEGGWPLERLPPGWAARAAAWQRELEAARASYPEGRGHRTDTTLGRVAAGIAAALAGRLPDRPTLGALRRAMAGAVHKRGPVDGIGLRALRSEQAAVAARPTHGALARILAARLETVPPEGGVADTESFSGPLTPAEGPSGFPLPPAILRRLVLCLDATIAEHVASGVVASAEVLAELLPQITAGAVTAAIEDATLRGLFAAIYAAFRRRRTLLLLHLESQVRFEELPWIAVLAPFRAQSDAAATGARAALEDTTLLTLGAFPMTILPNPLLSELGTLAKAAGLTLPLVEEIAADIFMGTFTPRFADAAREASTLLAGRLYARYYDLPVAEVYDGGGVVDRWGRRADEAFAARCRARAQEAGWREGGRGVAKNGTILEQAQILTTHNLATLVGRLGLASRLPRGAGDTCLTWILEQLGQVPASPHHALVRRKNVAYAWRQMLFVLSFDPPEAVADWLAENRTRALAEPELAEAWMGLEGVLGGGRFDADGRLGEGRRLLGWRA